MASASRNSASSRFRRAASSANCASRIASSERSRPSLEAQQNVALAHAVAVAHQDLAHRAALDMLDHPVSALDFDQAGGDDRARDRGEQAPAEEAADQDHRPAEPEHHAPARREASGAGPPRHSHALPRGLRHSHALPREPRDGGDALSARIRAVAPRCVRRDRLGRGSRKGRDLSVACLRGAALGRRQSAAALLRACLQAPDRRLAAARRGGHRAPGLHHIHPVALRERTVPVGHDHRRAAALLVPLHRARERHRPLGVQVGIGLVHHHQHGRAVEGAGRRDALALAAGERRAPCRHLEVVAAGQPQDHLVRAGALGRIDHVLVPGGGRHAGDVLRHGPLEEHHLLRQVADMLAQRRAVLVELRAVEAHRAAGRPPDAGERPRQRGLARGRRPRDSRRLARLEPEGCAAHRRRPGAGRRHREPLRLQDRAGCGQRRAVLLQRRLLQQLRQRAPRVQHALQQRPLRHRLIDRRERAPQQDRGRDHHAEAHLAVDREPGAEPQHHRLEEEPERLRGDAEEAAPVRGRERAVEQLVPEPARARDHRVLHTEAGHGLAAGPHLLDEECGPVVRLAHLPLEPRRPRLVEQRDEEQQDAGEHRQRAQHPVEHEEHAQEYRRPRRIEEGEGARAREEALDRLQIAHARRGPRPFGRRDRPRQDRPQHARIELGLQPCAGPRKHPAARVIENAHHQEEEGHDADEREQRRLRARGQHPVVDLEHEERPGQHQDVHEDAEEAHGYEEAPALRKRRPDLPIAVPARCHRIAVLGAGPWTH